MPVSGDGWPVRPMTEVPSARRVIGHVYELITGDPQDGEHPYVGYTTQTPHQRVHGPNGHTSPASIAKDPWKARILPGKAGYRILERVRDTGEGDRANDAALRRAEAFWIDRLRPTHNDVRPVRPPLHETGPVPLARPRGLTAAERERLARRRRARRRVIAFAVLAALGTFLAARVVLAMHLPWPAAPWVASPALGMAAAWFVFTALDHQLAILTGRARPRRSRRRRYHYR